MPFQEPLPWLITPQQVLLEQLEMPWFVIKFSPWLILSLWRFLRVSLQLLPWPKLLL
jgi:hypothetical protein